MPLLLILASFVIFSMVYLAPGSPEATLLGGRQASDQAYQEIRDEYNLDDPFFVQYTSWLGRFVSGDLGESIALQDTAANAIKPRIIPTLELTLLASLFIVLVGIAIGMIAALRAGKPTDMGVS